MRVAGIVVKAGVIHIAVVERENDETGLGTGVGPAFARLSPPHALSGAPELREFKERVHQEFRDWNVQSVVLLSTAKHAQWKYRDARSRVLSISAVMFAAAEADIPYSEVTPSAVEKTVLKTKIDRLQPPSLGFPETPKYWTTGGRDAYAAAAYGATFSE